MTSTLTKAKIQKLQERLLTEKESIENHFEINQESSEIAESSLRDSTGELSSVDNHPADIGTETYERGRDQALDEHQNNELEQINHALEKIKDGSYGLCEVCGQPIPYERLEALPFTTLCIDDAAQAGQGKLNERRPVEEQVMTPPPRGAGEISQRNAGKFDNAEAWETVKEFGNSDSPATSTKRDVKDYDDM
ncbi:TraR/DksA C4-type zinc finger protein [Paenibacillus sp. Marseille-Q4541]|uniref:TraR/DksA C4-type zinc finger protein n=1 Tax=Paenibacillus sp. Marseille-Q4541 TaxID=2831522 RepID=UPI001BAC1703|nr:TraR/DksA C4-type zinc finger protein [Paenibacillus sp. Marseille-Q4541]